MDPDLPAEYPSNYDDKLKLLDLMLEKGLVKLVAYATKMGYLEPPYGRDPEPTPYLSEERFIKSGALRKALGLASPREDGSTGNYDEDNEPEIKFTYGFCPMKFLSEYLYWAHPDAVKQRILDRENACKRLVFRAKHAKRQIAVQEELQEICRLCESGIAWGPVVSPKSDASMLCIVQPFKAGKVIFEISDTTTFDVIIATFSQDTQNRRLVKKIIKDVESVTAITAETEALAMPSTAGDKKTEKAAGAGAELEVFEETKDGSADTASTLLVAEMPAPVKPQEEVVEEEYEYTLPVKQVIDGLVAGTLYYLRCTLFAPPGEGSGNACFSGESYRTSIFRALSSEAAVAPSGDDVNPCPDPNVFPPVTLMAMGVLGGMLPTAVISVDDLITAHSSQGPDVVAARVGHFISCVVGEVVPVVSEVDNIASRHAFYAHVWSLYKRAMSYSPDGNALFAHPALLSIDNCSKGALQLLLDEEEVYKAYQDELKRFNKKKKAGTVKPKKGTEPTLARPPPSPSLSNILEALPVLSSDSLPTRGLYHTFTVGGAAAMKVFVLEAREGGVGKLQVEWLKNELRSSEACWRVVVTPAPLVFSPGTCVQAPAVSSRPGTGKIGLSLPDPSKECDDFGYLTSSLQHVMVDMYHQSSSNEHSAGGKDAMSVGSGAAGPEAARGDDGTVDDSRTIDSTGVESRNDGSVTVASGVVFLTGGAWALPYVASFDPGHLNEHFCVEVGVGRAAYNVEGVSERFVDVDDLALTVMFTAARSECLPGAGYTGSLSLQADGSMAVTIVKAVEADGSAQLEVVHKAVLYSGRRTQLIREH